MKQNHCSFSFRILFFGVLLFGCNSSVFIQQRKLPIIGSPCELEIVQSCQQNCQMVNDSSELSIEQEIENGVNLSNFELSVCNGQFESIFYCYLNQLGDSACGTLANIINRKNYKQVLENPVCQCVGLFS